MERRETGRDPCGSRSGTPQVTIRPRVTTRMTATKTQEEINDDSEMAVSATADLVVASAMNDHKNVGRMWIGASLLFLALVSILGIVTNLERLSLGSADIFGSNASYFQGWVLYRTSAIFLVALPLFIGIATAIVPLQVGSPSIAFPRLAAASFWTWIVGSIIHIISFFGADGGLGPANGTRAEGTLLTMVSLGFIVIAILAASVCIATTIIALRPVGMGLQRVPVFSWSMLVATSVWLLSLPVLIANLIFAYADLQGREPIAFGNRDLLWGNLEWAWSQPQIYAYAIPVLGVVSEVIPTLSKQRQVNRDVILGLIGLFGLLSFGAWAQSALSRGADPAFQNPSIPEGEQGNFIYEEFLFIAFALIIALPLLGILGGVADTIRRGKFPKPTAALMGAAMGVMLLMLAVVAGEVRAIPFFDALHDNHVLLSSATAQLTLVFGAVIASGIGAVAYWAPKLFGGYTADSIGGLAAALILGGAGLAGVADISSAFAGQPDVSIEALNSGAIDTANVLAFVGVIGLAGGALAFIASVLPALRNSELLPDDPWDGHTLEWATPSPPPVGNFVEPVGRIHSPEPLLDEFEEVN